MTLGKYLRMPDLTRKLGLARSTVYKIIKEEGFPPPIKLSRRAVAWDEQEVDAYLTQRKEARTR